TLPQERDIAGTAEHANELRTALSSRDTDRHSWPSFHNLSELETEQADREMESTMPMKRFLPILLLFAVTSARPIDKATNNVFPGKTWVKVSPEELGWSASGLQEARKYFDTLPPANLIVVDRGRVAVEWGDPAMRIMVSSMRKSVLSVL